ncbi:MAG: CinA family protein [Acetobacteraceae bacterium]
MDILLPKATAIAELLKARGQTIAVAESSAGGLVSAALLAVPGASAYFMGGAIIYTGRARAGLLDIADAAMQGVRPSTEAYAALLARRLRERLGTDWAIAETGATGPTGNRYGDAPGHACLAVSGSVDRTVTLETGGADRVANMRRFAAALLDLLAECLRA